MPFARFEVHVVAIFLNRIIIHQADPTVFMFALWASHMVTPTDLLTGDFTLRTAFCMIFQMLL